MKPSIPALRSLGMIFAAILLMQCTKEHNITNAGDFLPVATAGAIVDLGPVSGEVRRMTLSLTGVYTLLNGSTELPEETTSYIALEIFTPTDGVIADGVYYYSDAPEPQPFTFKSASLYMGMGDEVGLSSHPVNSGALIITRTGTLYNVSIDGTLATGHTVNGSFEGNLSYEDKELR
jgi:hypothetical protein